MNSVTFIKCSMPIDKTVYDSEGTEKNATKNAKKTAFEKVSVLNQAWFSDECKNSLSYFFILCAPVIVPTILSEMNKASSRSYLLAIYNVIGSTAILAHFYQTRKFVAHGDLNISDVARFSVASIFIGLFNLTYCFPASPRCWTWWR